MKIQQLTISGFRGFNDPCELLIHDRLTIIYGPNSHGKTSISEALEWLLFERTSKVKGGDYSKEEYKGSYRNAHLPSTRNPFVEAVMVKDGVSVVYKSHLEAEEKCTKFCDGQPVNTWPFTMQENDPGNPFILQHSLKELLLTKPDDRFQGFARLMGLDVLEQIQANIISLCTKPKLPLAIEQLLTRVKALEDRLEARPALAAIAKAYKKPGNSLDVIYKVILAECEKRVPAGTPTNDILPQLLRIRDEGRSKVFKATLSLPKLIADDRLANTSDEQLFLELISQDFIRRYLTLANLAAVQHLLDKAKFFDVGIQLLQADPQRCPFCGREMDEELTLHIGRVHTDLKIKQSSHADLEGERRQIGRVITSIKDHLGHYRRRLVVRCSKFLAAKDSLPALNGLLGTTQASHYSAVESAVVAMEPLVAEFEAADIGVTTHLQQLEASLAASNESDSIATAAGTSLIRVVSAGRALATAIDTYAEPVLNADRIVKYELDKLAGTEDATVLIDLQSQRDEILKKSKINATVEGLRDASRSGSTRREAYAVSHQRHTH